MPRTRFLPWLRSRIPSRTPPARRHQLRLDTLEARLAPALATLTTNYDIREDLTGDGLTADDPSMPGAVVQIASTTYSFSHFFVEDENGKSYSHSTIAPPSESTWATGGSGSAVASVASHVEPLYRITFSGEREGYSIGLVDQLTRTELSVPSETAGVFTGDHLDGGIPDGWDVLARDFGDPSHANAAVGYPVDSATLDYAASYFRPATVEGRLYADNNGNGVRDGDEAWLSGIPVYLDADGDPFTVSQTGPGRLDVRVSDPDGDGRGALKSVAVADTTASQSRLGLTVSRATGGNGVVRVGGVTGGGLKAISAPKADLTGPLALTGPLGGLTLHDLSDGASLDLGGPIASLTAAHVGAATIAAPSLGALTVQGDRAAGLAADFEGTLNLSGAGVPAGKPVLGRVTIGGAADGATFQVGGNVGAFTAQAFRDSRLLVGFTPDPLDPLGGTFQLQAEVGSFNVTGVPRSTAPAYTGSLVAVSRLKSATLASVAVTSAGGRYGVVSEEIGALKVTAPRFRYDPAGSGPQELGDFRIIVL